MAPSGETAIELELGVSCGHHKFFDAYANAIPAPFSCPPRLGRELPFLLKQKMPGQAGHENWQSGIPRTHDSRLLLILSRLYGVPDHVADEQGSKGEQCNGQF